MYLTLTYCKVAAGLVFPFPFLPPVTLPHSLGIDVMYCTMVQLYCIYRLVGRQAGWNERKIKIGSDRNTSVSLDTCEVRY